MNDIHNSHFSFWLFHGCEQICSIQNSLFFHLILFSFVVGLFYAGMIMLYLCFQLLPNIQLIRILNPFVNLLICVALFDFLIFSRILSYVLFCFYSISLVCIAYLYRSILTYLTENRVYSVQCARMNRKIQHPNIFIASTFSNKKKIKKILKRNNVLRQTMKRTSKRVNGKVQSWL